MTPPAAPRPCRGLLHEFRFSLEGGHVCIHCGTEARPVSPEAAPPRCTALWANERRCRYDAGHEGPHGYDHTEPRDMTLNQCDGCRRGLPVVDGIHRGPSPFDMIGCTAARYAEAAPPRATTPPEWPLATCAACDYHQFTCAPWPECIKCGHQNTESTPTRATVLEPDRAEDFLVALDDFSSEGTPRAKWFARLAAYLREMVAVKKAMAQQLAALTSNAVRLAGSPSLESVAERLDDAEIYMAQQRERIATLERDAARMREAATRWAQAEDAYEAHDSQNLRGDVETNAWCLKREELHGDRVTARFAVLREARALSPSGEPTTTPQQQDQG